MNRDELRALQAPLKQRYRDDPRAGIVTLSAEGCLGDEVSCRVETGRALVEAGLHPATGGTGALACSGDMLLQALVACAGVTLSAVATSLGIAVRGGTLRAEGDLDFRGTLGVAKDAPVGFTRIRLTIDLDMKIHDAEAVTDAGPYSPCGDITPNFKALKGVTIGAGWRKKTLEILGGIKGCTHLVELLGPLGTTAFQATGRAREQRNAGKPITKKPYQLGACHMYDETSPAVKVRWPQYYRGK